MVALAAGCWKILSSSQEGVFGKKTLDVTVPTFLQKPDAAVVVLCAYRLQAYFMLAKQLIKCRVACSRVDTHLLDIL